MSNDVVIVWFRHDLRTTDHPALTAAAATGAQIVPVYILDDDSAGDWKMGGASRWWLHKSLEALTASLSALGARLILRSGRAPDVLADLARDTQAKAVYCTRSYEPWAKAVEAELRQRLLAGGVAMKRYSGALLHEPDQLETKSGGPYKVYTPFWRALHDRVTVKQPLPAPETLTGYGKPVVSETLSSWRLLPKKPDWAKGLREAWQPGEVAAHKQLEMFVKAALPIYSDGRNRPDRPLTSRLSPYLHFGEITPRQCWHAALAAHQARKTQTESETVSLETFLKELAWREFSYHLLFHMPDLPTNPVRPEFKTYPWEKNAKALKAWQVGKTGYPIVDAGMRELWHTGWMHNRVRMITASFLIKDLLIHWQHGEQWFWDTLVDADLASNAASWQWVAGCGADAAPYFRIFHPVKQGEKFDPDGQYVRRWVPELADVPNTWIHQPWTAPPDVLKDAGVKLGKTYPKPIVDHAEQRTKALHGYETIKPKRLAS